MRPSFLWLCLMIAPALGLGSLGLATSAHAQDNATIASELERLASSTPEEKRLYAASSNKEIATIEQAMATLLEEAKADGDASAVECIQPRLTSIRALQNVSVDSERKMLEALAAGSDARADHEFRKIAVAINKARTIWAQAQRCVDYDTDQDTYVQVDWESFLNDVALSSVAGAFDDPALGFFGPDVSPF